MAIGISWGSLLIPLWASSGGWSFWQCHLCRSKWETRQERRPRSQLCDWSFQADACAAVWTLKIVFPPWVLLSSTVKERNLAQQKVNQAWFHRRLTGQDRWLTPPPWWGKVWKKENVIDNGKRRQRRRIKTRQEGAKCPNGYTSFSLTTKIKGLFAGR